MIVIMYPTIVTLFDDAASSTLEKDELLFRSGEPISFMYLVERGALQLVRHTLSGSRLVLSRVRPSQVLAEASAYSKTYHCDSIALGPSSVKRIPTAVFLQRLTANPDLQHIWAKTLAHELQAARMNAEVRTLRTVAEKLDVWLETNPSLPPKGERQMLAQILGVSREALYRELAKRKA
jgi:CRP-like cAMP-binding protein